MYVYVVVSGCVKQRCGRNEFSCRSVCRGRLASWHACPEVCHAGECAPCEEVWCWTSQNINAGQRCKTCDVVCVHVSMLDCVCV
jgi:hypothetical protein